MAKVFHVIRTANCLPMTLEQVLQEITESGGDVVTILLHATIQDNATHDHRYCVTDIVYTTH